jgi:8-oxo-dGTP pyrophosphatase MutT (NUDIX family)
MAAPTPIHDELHRIATTAIIWRKDADGYRYLVTKRSPSKKVWPGKWTVPGGGLEVADYIDSVDAVYQNSESPQWYDVVEKGLAREIAEEVGVAVRNLVPAGNVAFIRPDGVPVLVLRYYGEYAGGEVVLDEDATEHAWVTAEEAQDYDFIGGIEGEIMDVERRLSA